MSDFELIYAKDRRITAKGRGKTWARSLDAAMAKVKDDQAYLITRNGGFFRPKAQGYTTNVAHAGLFMGPDARCYLGAEGVAVTPINAVRRQLAARARQIAEDLARLQDLICAALVEEQPQKAAAHGRDGGV